MSSDLNSINKVELNVSSNKKAKKIELFIDFFKSKKCSRISRKKWRHWGIIKLILIEFSWI